VRKVYAWIDQRTGIESARRWFLDEPIPGGARWAYVFGSGLLLALVIQLLTGIALALYYVPSVGSAHVTVAYLTKQVWSGSFIRSLHAYGSHFIVLLLFAHLIQTFVYGAYKGRREILWLSGVCLLLLLAGMAFTGYLLPWDQRAYFATVVGTNVMSEAPVVGPILKRLLRGGDNMGTLTLSRFYVLHIIILPLGILCLAALHVYLFRRSGPAGPAGNDLPQGSKFTQPFYPRQLLMDIAFGAVLLGAIATVAHFVPISLGPEANPSDSQYIPRPEWYFLPLFQWLKYWQGERAVIGIVVIPTLAILMLAAIPFLDRKKERRPSKRRLAIIIFSAGLGTVCLLGFLSRRDDRRDPAIKLQLARQEQEVDKYMKQPFVPVPSGTSTVVPASSPEILAGQKAFTDHQCVFCHGEGALGTPAAPRLVEIAGQTSSTDLAKLIRKPNAKMAAGKMPAFKGTDEELQALIVYLKSLH
jgi:ubiquinol-cytochrome c reductase cytochrome b subunit